MIMINGNWEQVKDLSDIIRIVNENIGYEFSQKVEEIFRYNEDKIEDLEIRISELELKVDHLKELNKQLDKLENYINCTGENEDSTTDFVKGMMKAYEMIKR